MSTLATRELRGTPAPGADLIDHALERRVMAQAVLNLDSARIIVANLQADALTAEHYGALHTALTRLVPESEAEIDTEHLLATFSRLAKLQRGETVTFLSTIVGATIGTGGNLTYRTEAGLRKAIAKANELADRRRVLQEVEAVRRAAERGVGTPQAIERLRASLIGAAPATNGNGHARPLFVRASDIQENAVRWTWPGWLETGALNLIAADPGSGKSLLTAALAAAVSTGARWPDGKADFGRQPRHVLFITSEDDPGKSTRPRLRVAGADLNCVSILRQVADHGRDRAFCLQRDLAAIEDATRELPDLELVIIDPLDSYLGRADSNANEEVRRVLEPLVLVAERNGLCVLLVKHLNKASATPNSLYRIGGSMAFVALPRAVHVVGSDPENKDRKLFMPVKVNHGRKPEALAYVVRQTQDGQPVIEWEAESVAADADDVLSHRPNRTGVTDRAEAWLAEALSSGPMSSRELDDAADAAGIAAATLRKAKERLRVVSRQVRTADGRRVVGWEVALP